MVKGNCIVTACDANYVWGVWLLIGSMRRADMSEKVLVAAYDWPEIWINNIRKFPNVEVLMLEKTDCRCITCNKPDIILKADSEIVTWVDCDGFFTGNCSADLFSSDSSKIYIRPRTASEVVQLYAKQRSEGEAKDEVPKKILDIWQRDVDERQNPVRKRGCSAAIISVHHDQLPFIQKWQRQIMKVLPWNVGVVDDGNVAYFQTDESVMNSMLLFAEDAPPMTDNYRADLTDRAHFVHFGYTPKPWQMWNKYSIRHFDAVAELAEWMCVNGFAPHCKLPFTFKQQNKKKCIFLSNFAKFVNKWQKIKTRILKRKS